MYLRIFGVSQVPINLTHTHRNTRFRSTSEAGWLFYRYQIGTNLVPNQNPSFKNFLRER